MKTISKMKSLLAVALGVMMGALSCAYGQLDVKLEPVRRDYVLGENVSFKLTIINHTDSSIALTNTPGRCWLYLDIMRSGDMTGVTQNSVPRYPDLTLTPGSRRTYEIQVQPYYDIVREGVYRVIATVRLPDMSTTYTSNAASVNVTSGGEVQSFRIQARGQHLQVSLRLLVINGKSLLFGQVMNADTRIVQGACFMGQFLSFMRPRVLLDRAQNLHMLCQSTPKLFTYAVMDTYGRRREYKVMQQTGGFVDLVSTGGGIRCVGVAPYTKPKGEKAKYHSASERP